MPLTVCCCDALELARLRHGTRAKRGPHSLGCSLSWEETSPWGCLAPNPPGCSATQCGASPCPQGGVAVLDLAVSMVGCVGTCGCMYACAPACGCEWACICACLHLCACECICMCTCEHGHARVCTNVNVCAQMCVHACACVCLGVHACMYMYVHAGCNLAVLTLHSKDLPWSCASQPCCGCQSPMVDAWLSQ